MWQQGHTPTCVLAQLLKVRVHNTVHVFLHSACTVLCTNTSARAHVSGCESPVILKEPPAMPDAQLMCSRLCLNIERNCINLHSDDLRLPSGETSEVKIRSLAMLRYILL